MATYQAAALDRRSVAEELIALRREYAEVYRRDDDLVAKLREIAIAEGAGFVEPFDGGAEVKVSGGAEKKFKGIMPVFNAEAFMALPTTRRNKLVESGLVVMEEQYTSARKPSVSVSL
jgi:hypothetical protein